MNTTDTDEIKKENTALAPEREALLKKFSTEAELANAEADRKLDEECSKLDAAFEKACENATEDEQDELQAKYRQDFATIARKIKKELDEKLAEIMSAAMKTQI